MSEKINPRDDKDLLTWRDAKRVKAAYKKFCEKRGLVRGFAFSKRRKRG